MHLDNSIILTITLNIFFILTISWLGLRLINNHLASRIDNRVGTTRVSKAVKETSVITPRIKASFRIRRMIKTSSDSDEAPFFSLS